MRANRLFVTVAIAVLTVGTGVVLRHAEAVEPSLQTLTLDGSDVRRDTQPFSLLGVTWPDPLARIGGTIEVRTRSAATGEWTAWQGLESDGPGSGDRRGSTDPLWVGTSNAVEARVGGRSGLPAGLRLDLINPDAHVRPRTAPITENVAYTRAADGPVIPARPFPPYVSRAAWGANESMVKGSTEYTGPTQVFFVHHTATGNDYSCAQSASIVRGIEAYQVNSKGWNDVGYNFLVDKCGTIFEGRAGGATRSVLGAHTLGFNTDSSAVAVIGTYDNVGVTPAARNAIAALAAWKLGSNSPAGTVGLTSGGTNRFARGTHVVLHRIAGHRDTALTDCPGADLEAQLPGIRAVAAAAPYGFKLQAMIGTHKVGTVFYTRGAFRPVWTVGTPNILLSRFEVWVDGSLSSATVNATRSESMKLAPGVHTVALSAVHLNGRRAITSARVVVDDTAPSFTAHPDVALRTGGVGGTLPVRVGWNAADSGGLAAFQITGTTPALSGPDVRGWAGAIAVDQSTTFTVKAEDRAGNVAGASVTRTGTISSERSAARTGAWVNYSSPDYLGGTALGSTAAGATASWTVTGRSAALVFRRSPTAGAVRITVDGTDAGTLDLQAGTTEYRQAAWTRYWPAGGTHTVKIENLGTPGRPAVVLDGLAYLN